MTSLAGRIENAAVPLYLITIGAIFLVADYGGPSVRRTWPALLIAFGAVRLAAFWARKTNDEAHV